MTECIKKIQIGDKIYQAKTDFRTALKCNEIAEDYEIGNLERGLAIICVVFGEEGLNIPEHYEKLLKWYLNYLSCGKEIKDTNEEPDMDYIQDMEYIEASFMSDYGIDLTEENMDWQKFNKLINGLSNSELGNCCVLNRVRNLRNFDPKEIKDKKERDKIIKAKKEVALKKRKQKRDISKEQMNEVKDLLQRLSS